VVYLGDSITGENIVDNATVYWQQMLNPSIQLGYSWGTVFGNHDGISPGERGTREDLLEVDMSFEGSYTQKGPDNIHGIGNYYLPIYPYLESADEEPVSILYFFDSGGEPGEPYLIYEDQVEWYRTISRSFRGQSNYPLLSFAFFHIPLIQYSGAYNQNLCYGMREDGAGGQYRDSGLLSAFEEEDDVQAVFVGHDHGNDWCCPLQSVELCFGRRTGYGGYGTWNQGSRIIEISQNKGFKELDFKETSIKHFKTIKNEKLIKPKNKQMKNDVNYRLYVRLEKGEILP